MVGKNKGVDAAQDDNEEDKKLVKWRNPNKTQLKFIQGYAHHGDVDRALKAVSCNKDDLERWKNIPNLHIVRRMEKARAEKQTEYVKRLESMSKGEGKSTDKSFQACKEWLRANNEEYKEKDDKKGFHGMFGVIALPGEINIADLGLKVVDAETIDMSQIEQKREEKKDGDDG